MNTSALIGRLFSIGCSLGALGVVSGGKQGVNLDKVEYSGLLSGLNQLEMWLAYAKYGLDDQAKNKLSEFVLQYTQLLALQNNWNCPADLLERISQLVVAEVLNDNLCRSCNGTGVLVGKSCRSCHGTGKKPVSGRFKAKQIGICQSQWLRVWSSRYEELFRYINHIDSAVVRHFHDVCH
jgi:ribosomal protein L40E